MSAKQNRTPEDWRQIVNEWEASGLPAKEFAASKCLGANKLYAWRARLRGAVVPRTRSSATAGDGKASARAAVFAPVHVSRVSADVCGSRIEIVTRDGRLVRVQGKIDAEALQAVLVVVERC